jgi:hypothetical protein
MCARHGLVALGARTAGHANLARGHHEEFAALELIRLSDSNGEIGPIPTLTLVANSSRSLRKIFGRQ